MLLTRSRSPPRPNTKNQGWTVHPFEKSVDWEFIHPQFKVRLLPLG